MIKYYVDNAFWEKEDKSVAKAIEVVDNEGETKVSAQVTLYVGTPEYDKLVAQLGVDKISENTRARIEEKQSQKKKDIIENERRIKAEENERLFTEKLKLFENEHVKNTPNRELRSKLRKATSLLEVQTLSMLIMLEKLGYSVTKLDD